MGQGAESNIGLILDKPAADDLDDPPWIVYVVQGAGVIDIEADPIPWSAKDALRSAAISGLTDWLQHLDTYHHSVWVTIGSATSAQRQRMHRATLYLPS